MPPVARTELDPGTPCSNCGQALPPGTSACPACGAAHGEGNRCPHCHSIADVEPHGALGFRCLICGGPRIALSSAEMALGAQTNAALSSAGSEQAKHLMFSAGGFVLSGMGALALLIAGVVELSASPGLGAMLAAYIAAAVPLATGLFALDRAAAARKRRNAALSSAQISALSDVQAAVGPLSAARVVQLLRVSSERAELLLAEASVASMLDEAPAPRLRVGAAEPTSPAGATEHHATKTEIGEPAGKTVRGDTEI